jgi:opacity protein-like surface antigen
MKKLNISFFLMISVLITANAQFTKIGGGLALSNGFRFHQQSWSGNKSGIIALSVKGIYEISAPFHISPSFSVFYPHITKDQVSEQTLSSMMFDINGHYVINSTDRLKIYGLAGFDILFANNKISSEGYPASKETDNALGLNVGLGTYLKITDKLDIYAEAKYLFNNKYNQLMVNAGVLINVGRVKKEENTDQ